MGVATCNHKVNNALFVLQATIAAVEDWVGVATCDHKVNNALFVLQAMIAAVEDWEQG